MYSFGGKRVHKGIGGTHTVNDDSIRKPWQLDCGTEATCRPYRKGIRLAEERNFAYQFHEAL